MLPITQPVIPLLHTVKTIVADSASAQSERDVSNVPYSAPSLKITHHASSSSGRVSLEKQFPALAKSMEADIPTEPSCTLRENTKNRVQDLLGDSFTIGAKQDSKIQEITSLLIEVNSSRLEAVFMGIHDALTHCDAAILSLEKTRKLMSRQKKSTRKVSLQISIHIGNAECITKSLLQGIKTALDQDPQREVLHAMMRILRRTLKYVDDADLNAWQGFVNTVLSKAPELKNPVRKEFNYFWSGKGPTQEEFHNMVVNIRTHPQFTFNVWTFDVYAMEETFLKLMEGELGRDQLYGDEIEELKKEWSDKQKEERGNFRCSLRDRIQIQDWNTVPMSEKMRSLAIRHFHGTGSNYPAVKDVIVYPILKHRGGGIGIDWDARFHGSLPDELNAPLGILVRVTKSVHNEGGSLIKGKGIGNSMIAFPEDLEICDALMEEMVIRNEDMRLSWYTGPELSVEKALPGKKVALPELTPEEERRLIQRAFDPADTLEQRAEKKREMQPARLRAVQILAQRKRYPMWDDIRRKIEKTEDDSVLRACPRLQLTLDSTGPGLLQAVLENQYGEYSNEKYSIMNLFGDLIDCGAIEDNGSAQWVFKKPSAHRQRSNSLANTQFKEKQLQSASEK